MRVPALAIVFGVLALSVPARTASAQARGKIHATAYITSGSPPVDVRLLVRSAARERGSFPVDRNTTVGLAAVSVRLHILRAPTENVVGGGRLPTEIIVLVEYVAN